MISTVVFGSWVMIIMINSMAGKCFTSHVISWWSGFIHGAGQACLAYLLHFSPKKGGWRGSHTIWPMNTLIDSWFEIVWMYKWKNVKVLPILVSEKWYCKIVGLKWMANYSSLKCIIELHWVHKYILTLWTHATQRNEIRESESGSFLAYNTHDLPRRSAPCPHSLVYGFVSQA